MSACSPHVEALIDLAFEEDIGGGDKTTEVSVAVGQQGVATIQAKQTLVLCGQEVSARIFERLDPRSRYSTLVEDGTLVTSGTKVATLSGSLSALLTGERTALNFLQRLSGVATRTHEFVAILKGSEVQLLDTRKTAPGWRELEKYAVRCGGGHNHRIGLFDAVLFKNNHIDIAKKRMAALVAECRTRWGHSVRVQIEVRNKVEIDEALAAEPDALLLDNFSAAELRRVVASIRAQSSGSKIFLEASGGISAENLGEYRIPGLNAVSSGAITHSAKAVDLSMSITLKA